MKIQIHRDSAWRTITKFDLQMGRYQWAIISFYSRACPYLASFLADLVGRCRWGQGEGVDDSAELDVAGAEVKVIAARFALGGRNEKQHKQLKRSTHFWLMFVALRLPLKWIKNRFCRILISVISYLKRVMGSLSEAIMIVHCSSVVILEPTP